MDLENIIQKRAWYEKYRPKSLDDLKLDDHMMAKFTHYIQHPFLSP